MPMGNASTHQGNQAVPHIADYWSTHAVLRKLGSGRFGRVFLVQSGSSKRPRALKQFRNGSADVLREVAALQALQAQADAQLGVPSVHCVAYVPSADHRDELLLSAELEYAEGDDLFTLIGSLSDRDVLDVFRGTLGALRRLHAARLVHRDVKLENVVWDAARRSAVLIDVGFLCREPDAAPCWARLPPCSEAALRGTLAYAPPETLARPSCASDVWALGVLLLELLLGAALDADEVEPLVDAVHAGGLGELLGARAAWQPLLQRMLCADPARRATAADLEAQLDLFTETAQRR